MNKKIYGFYLVVLMNDWRNVFISQFEKLIRSELFVKTDKLHLRVFYSNEHDLEFIKSYVKNFDKISLNYTNVNEYEFGILEFMQNISYKENFYCYYLHTKGVSIDHNNMFKYKNATDLVLLKNNISSWREYMEYFLIDLHLECINELNNGYDACGVQLTNNPSKHFSGNFWWAKSELLKKLPKINSLDQTKRHLSEFWIGMGDGNLKGLFYTNQAGYRTTITDNYRG